MIVWLVPSEDNSWIAMPDFLSDKALALLSLTTIFTDFMVEKGLYNQQNNAVCRIKLPFKDHWCKSRRKVGLEQNLVLHQNLLALSQNYIYWWRQTVHNQNLNPSIHTSQFPWYSNWHRRILWITVSKVFWKSPIIHN